jgi:hypothetical protein
MPGAHPLIVTFPPLQSDGRGGSVWTELGETKMAFKMRILAATAITLAATNTLQAADASGDGHKVLAADAIAWTAGPPSLPKGTELAVLAGNPGAPGLFILRARFPDGMRIAPNWHSQAEYVTVLQGEFRVGTGKTFDVTAATPITPGGFFMAPAQMAHFGNMKGRTVLEVVGIGPFDLHYVNPEDDPSAAK